MNLKQMMIMVGVLEAIKLSLGPKPRINNV